MILVITSLSAADAIRARVQVFGTLQLVKGDRKGGLDALVTPSEGERPRCPFFAVRTMYT